MKTPDHATDIAIIGAGPVGLFTVFEAGMLGMRCHVIEALDALGGQCYALYPQKPIYDIPGIVRIDALDLVDQLAEQASPFAPVYHLGQQVATLTRTDAGRWRIAMTSGLEIEAAAVVVAAGVGAFGPNRPPLESLAEFEGKSVFYMVRRREDMAGKRVVIAGGGDSALDWALDLIGVAAHVTLVHRRRKFRASPHSERRLAELAQQGALELVVPYQLVGLEGRDGVLDAVRVATLDGEERRLTADVLLAFYGLAMSLGPINEWGLALERGHILVDADTCATNLPGVFAVGDIITYPGKLKLILTGFAETAIAVRSAYPFVHPNRALHFEYSTHTGVPGRE
jgi:thioredoxin reductase (NADPH)